MAKNWFQPPVNADVPSTYVARDTYAPVPRVATRLFRYYKRRAVGSSVLKHHDGTYEVLSYPTGSQIAAAAAYYEGGHIHPVDDEEAAALRAAGFTVVTE